MNQLIYPLVLTPRNDEEGFVVNFPDLPEAVAEGHNLAECLSEAECCLQEAIVMRINDRLEIPEPCNGEKYIFVATVPEQTAMKAKMYEALKKSQINVSRLAQQLQIRESEVRRILDPRQSTKLPLMEEALSALVKLTELTK